LLSGARVLNRLPLGPAPQSPARERVTKALIGGANILNRKHNWSGSAARLDAACQEGRSEFRRDHNLLSQNCARTVVVDPSWVYCLSESSFPKLLILGTSARSEWRSWSRSILFVISRSPVQFRRVAPEISAPSNSRLASSALPRNQHFKGSDDRPLPATAAPRGEPACGFAGIGDAAVFLARLLTV